MPLQNELFPKLNYILTYGSEMDPAEIVTRNMVELVTEEEIRSMDFPSAKVYQGFEPSGLPHLGTGVLWPRKLTDIASTGADVTVLLADWHAMINDKLGGDMERIRASGEIFRDSMKAMGLADSVKFLWASELVNNGTYLGTLLRVAKSSTRSRIVRALPIMGRKEEDVERDFSKFIYPLMQVTDIIEMDIDLALGAMDQRHAHMLCRDIQDKMNLKKTSAMHGPLLGSLKGTGRMDVNPDQFTKMSKSDPDSAIFLFDSESEIKRKIKGAFCPIGEIEGNPLADIMNLVIFPYYEGEIVIERPPNKGGRLVLNNSRQFNELYIRKEIHPLDLKATVSSVLTQMLEPARKLAESMTEKIEFVIGKRI